MKRIYQLLVTFLVLAFMGVFWHQNRFDQRLHDPLNAWRSSRKVARVFDQSISVSQLERAVDTHLWTLGKSSHDLTNDELSHLSRSVLGGLIDQALLTHAVATMQGDLGLTELELQERISRFTRQFESKEALETAMKSQGISDQKSLTAHITSQIRQEKFVEARIASAIHVTEAEARAWHDENPDAITNLERIEVRHLFMPTLDHASETARQTLENALHRLASGNATFTELAREVSEDPASKNSGGELGWMTHDRLPPDLADSVFLLDLYQPTLIQSRLGWHLIEMTGHNPKEARPFDQAQPEIIAALETIKRRDATAKLRMSFRESAVSQITIYPDALPSLGGMTKRD